MHRALISDRSGQKIMALLGKHVSSAHPTPRLSWSEFETRLGLNELGWLRPTINAVVGGWCPAPILALP